MSNGGHHKIILLIGIFLIGLGSSLGWFFMNRTETGFEEVGAAVFMTGLITGLGIMISAVFIKSVVAPGRKLSPEPSDWFSGSAADSGVSGWIPSEKMSEMTKEIEAVAEGVLEASKKLSHTSYRMNEGAAAQADSVDAAAFSINDLDKSGDEISEGVEVLSTSAQETASSLLEMSSSIREVANNAGGLATAVNDTSASITQMSASIRAVAENVNHLLASSNETETTVQDINKTVREVEKNAKESAALSRTVTTEAQESGMQSIEQTIAGMNKIQETVVKAADVINRLAERSEQIGKILTVIDGVTKQTNLLALNAAIMAAQSGEEGKGFAIVADEIKNLADRTGASTKEIAQLIGNVQAEAREAVESIHEGGKRVEEGVRLSVAAGETLKNILSKSSQSTEMAKNIELAAVNQTEGIRKITEAMQVISTMVQQIARATQEQSKGSEQIIHVSEKMRNMTRQVRISTEEQALGSRQITEAVENVNQHVQKIAKIDSGQKHGKDVIVKAIKDVRIISQDSVKVVEEMNQTIQDLTLQAEHLRQLVSRFRTNR